MVASKTRLSSVFFFQAEDGIRDDLVTGVQTCALPIFNTRTPAELPQRGHNKQKRGDLRQVSLGLLVSTDFHIPLLHWIYAGNVADSVQFRSVTEELSAHYKELAQTCQHITLIFDKGNNSEDSFETLAHSPFHFGGSLGQIG